MPVMSVTLSGLLNPFFEPWIQMFDDHQANDEAFAFALCIS